MRSLLRCKGQSQGGAGWDALAPLPDFKLTGRLDWKDRSGDEGSAEWESSRKASRGKVKAPWLQETLAKMESKRKPVRAAKVQDERESATSTRTLKKKKKVS